MASENRISVFLEDGEVLEVAESVDTGGERGELVARDIANSGYMHLAGDGKRVFYPARAIERVEVYSVEEYQQELKRRKDEEAATKRYWEELEAAFEEDRSAPDVNDSKLGEPDREERNLEPQVDEKAKRR